MITMINKLMNAADIANLVLFVGTLSVQKCTETSVYKTETLHYSMLHERKR